MSSPRSSGPDYAWRGLMDLAACGLLLAAACRSDSAGSQTDPKAPSGAGSRIEVPAGGDLQGALDRAHPNDEIVLEAGAIFRGPFTLPRKSGNGWITVRGSSPDEAIPGPGTRMAPSYAGTLPILESSEGSVLTAARGAHHFRIVGLEIRPRPGTRVVNLVTLGANEDSLDALPDYITIERCYLHGDPVKGTRRGVALNSRHTTIVDSARTRRRSAAGTGRARSRSRTTTWREPARTSFSAGPTRASRTWFRRTSRYAGTCCESRLPGRRASPSTRARPGRSRTCSSSRTPGGS